MMIDELELLWLSKGRSGGIYHKSGFCLPFYFSSLLITSVFALPQLISIRENLYHCSMIEQLFLHSCLLLFVLVTVMLCPDLSPSPA
jgi:hypothetical protein